MSFKSPQVHLIGKVKQARDFSQQSDSLYAKIEFKAGQYWRLVDGKNKFETFESEQVGDVCALQQPFDIHYVTEDMRGWPRILAQVWHVDNDGRHAIVGYGTMACPFTIGEYSLEIPCWRPKGTWFDNFIGAHSELQYKNIVVSPLNRYGLKTIATGKLIVQLKVLTKDFHLHGVINS